MAAPEPGTSSRRAVLGPPTGTARGPLSAWRNLGRGRRVPRGCCLQPPTPSGHRLPLGTGRFLSLENLPNTFLRPQRVLCPGGPSAPAAPLPRRPLPHALLVQAPHTPGGSPLGLCTGQTVVAGIAHCELVLDSTGPRIVLLLYPPHAASSVQPRLPEAKDHPSCENPRSVRTAEPGSARVTRSRRQAARAPADLPPAADPGPARYLLVMPGL